MNTIVLAVRDGILPKYHEAVFTKTYDPTDTVTMLRQAEQVLEDHTDIGENRLFVYDSGTTVELLAVIKAARQTGYKSIYVMCKNNITGEYYPVEVGLRGED